MDSFVPMCVLYGGMGDVEYIRRDNRSLSPPLPSLPLSPVRLNPQQRNTLDARTSRHLIPRPKIAAMRSLSSRGLEEGYNTAPWQVGRMVLPPSVSRAQAGSDIDITPSISFHLDAEAGLLPRGSRAL